MKRILIAIFILIFFVLPVDAAEEGYSDDFRDSVELEDSLLPEEVDLQEPDALQEQLGWEPISHYLGGLFKKTFSLGFQILIPGFSMVMLSVWVHHCCNTFAGTAVKTVFSLILALSMALLGQKHLQEAVNMMQAALESMKVFCTACIPSFSVVMIAAGENAGAAVFSSLMVLLGEVGVFVSSNLLMPLIHIYLSIGVCSAVGDEYNFSAVSKYIRRFIIWIIGIAVAGFRLILKLQVGAAAAGDLVAKKYIKIAVAGLIPFVGGSLSQGVEGLFSVATGAKTTFAIAGVLILVSVMLPSLLMAGIYGLSWSLCRWIATFLNDKTAVKITDVLSNGYYLILALGGGVTMMGLFSFFGLITWVA